MKKYQLFLSSILTGIILSLSWPANGLPILLFFGFIPLLFVEDYIYKNNKKNIFFYSYTAFFVWNLLTTWWIYNSTLFGVISVVILNSLFMSVPFFAFHLTKKYTNRNLGYLSLIVFWIAFEYFHLNWDLSWTWLNLGNGFASYPKYIQWYEYTGTSGGTFWILFANIFFYSLIIDLLEKRKLITKFMIKFCFALLLIILPIIFSYFIYNNYKETKNYVNIVIVQPNIDPYNEKFNGMTSDEQIKRVISLAKSKTDSLTDFVVCPETAIPEGVWENRLEYSNSINRLKNFITIFPKLKIVTGLSSYKMFEKGEKKSSTARKYPYDDMYYDAYNSAIFLDSSKNIQIYHKSKLVLGVEKMPFPGILKFLDKFALDLGGTTGSLGIQKQRSNFITHPDSIKIAPVICYESVYGEFISKYIKNGANLIFIITNDGWWGNTSGYKQHFQYARLRAVETRRSIVQSANTGTSGFINQRGDIIQSTQWWRPVAIKHKINTNSKITFFVRYGDYISKISVIISILLILTTVFNIIFNKKNH
jgi:apolipoprotein N-acyltransferase